MPEVSQSKQTLHGRRFLCGVPEESCQGGYVQTPNKPKKVHTSTDSAFNCMVKHLLAQGYTQRGGREFQEPNNGSILVLTKRSRYGNAFRPGKGRWMQEGTGCSFTSM